MKKLSGILLISFLFYTSLFSQMGYISSNNVVETPLSLMDTLRTSYSVAIHTDRDIAVNSWAVKMQNKDLKTYIMDANQKIFMTPNVRMPKINKDPLTVYFKPHIDGNYDGTLFTIWLKKPDGTFMSSENSPDSYDAISKWMIDFSLDTEERLKEKIDENNEEQAEFLFPATAKDQGKS